MLLREVKLRSKEMNLALDDGITKLEDFTLWYLGYMSGYRQRQKEVIEQLEKQKG